MTFTVTDNSDYRYSVADNDNIDTEAQNEWQKNNCTEYILFHTNNLMKMAKKEYQNIYDCNFKSVERGSGCLDFIYLSSSAF